ncbi:protein rolling stone-like [Diadema antillarum]|uniref:protein rolling stone-like n=1 Tax=Diadema antillarum TaxID=105358 RepID=UPI003A89F2CC
MCNRDCLSCSLDTRYPSDIVRPLCTPYANLKFLTYRMLLATYFTVYLVIHLSTNIVHVQGLKVFIYLSDWTLILTTLYLVVAFLNGIADYAYYLQHGAYTANSLFEPPILFRLQWLLFSICSITSLLISASFWPTAGIDLPAGKIFENFNIHALPSIVLLIDLAVTAVPIRFGHVFYPLVYGAVYLVFAAVYWALGGTDPFGRHYIYGILNFAHPKVILIVVFVEGLGALVFQWVLAGLSLLRNKIAKECNCAGRRNPETENMPLTEMTVTMVATYS